MGVGDCACCAFDRAVRHDITVKGRKSRYVTATVKFRDGGELCVIAQGETDAELDFAYVGVNGASCEE